MNIKKNEKRDTERQCLFGRLIEICPDQMQPVLDQ